jgi:predicted DNA-binding protein
MAMLSFRISEEEKNALNSFAQLHGITMSKAAREIILERIEDDEDRGAIEEYRQNSKHKTYTLAEMRKRLGV